MKKSSLIKTQRDIIRVLIESYEKIEFPNIIIAPVINRLWIFQLLILKIEYGFPSSKYRISTSSTQVRGHFRSLDESGQFRSQRSLPVMTSVLAGGAIGRCHSKVSVPERRFLYYWSI